jgi:hypothetical protein
MTIEEYIELFQALVPKVILSVDLVSKINISNKMLEMLTMERIFEFDSLDKAIIVVRGGKSHVEAL